MKVCEKCGTAQNDSNFRCIECGEIHGNAVSDEEREKIEKLQSDRIDDLSQHADITHRTKFDNILLFSGAVGFAASVLLYIFRRDTFGKPDMLIVSALIFLFCAILSAIPVKFDIWMLKLKMELKYGITDISPTDNFVLRRKASQILLFLAALIAMGLSI
ncbi:MAG: hypothetical protein ACI4XJ_08985 [Eubacteriales bacterium]